MRHEFFRIWRHYKKRLLAIFLIESAQRAWIIWRDSKRERAPVMRLGMGDTSFLNRYDIDTIPTIFSGVDTKFRSRYQ